MLTSGWDKPFPIQPETGWAFPEFNCNELCRCRGYQDRIELSIGHSYLHCLGSKATTQIAKYASCELLQIYGNDWLVRKRLSSTEQEEGQNQISNKNAIFSESVKNMLATNGQVAKHNSLILLDGNGSGWLPFKWVKNATIMKWDQDWLWFVKQIWNNHLWTINCQKI